MRAIAINPRRSAFQSPRIHFVKLGESAARCGLKPRNGWRPAARPVDCPDCLKPVTRLPTWAGVL